MGERSTILKETILFFSQSALIEEIQSVDWNAIFSDNSDIDSIFTNFYTQITHVFDMQKMVWVFLNCKFDMRWLVGPIQASKQAIRLVYHSLWKHVVEVCQGRRMWVKVFELCHKNICQDGWQWISYSTSMHLFNSFKQAIVETENMQYLELYF